MKTRAPKVAVRLSPVSTIALIGSSTLPVSRNSRTNMPMKSTMPAMGRRCLRMWKVSVLTAAGPPTLMPSKGALAWRMLLTRWVPAVEYGSTLGIADR